MAATETIQIPLGYKAPDFNLPDVRSNTMCSLNQLKGDNVTVIVFMCNHCPYVIHLREKMVEIAGNYLPKGVKFIAISSNDVENYPDDSPELMKQLAEELNFPFPYLYDESQEVAKAYDAACTPDFSVFDANLICRYRGQFDDSRPKNEKAVSGKDLIDCIETMLLGKEPSKNQKPSLGCNIKWKK